MDRVCIALACKSFGRLLADQPKLMALSREIRHGEEEEQVEQFAEMRCAFNEPGSDDEDAHSDWERENEDFLKVAARVEDEYENRTNPADLHNLFKRLEAGWLRSSARFCVDCALFVSTEQSFWDERDKFYTYQSSSKKARAWRLGQCNCGEYVLYGCHARVYARSWVKGETPARVCPDCKALRWQNHSEEGCHEENCPRSCCPYY